MSYHYFDDFEEMLHTEDDDFFDNVQKNVKEFSRPNPWQLLLRKIPQLRIVRNS